LAKATMVTQTRPEVEDIDEETPIQQEKKPVLQGQTRSIKIVDLQVRKRRRNPANCKYCNGQIEERYALSKGSRTGARYYHIKCAIRVGFDIVAG
jgi:hypothetical protein